MGRRDLLVVVIVAALLVSLAVLLAGSPGADAAARWRPEPGTSWQWQLSGKVNTSFNVDAYDIDGFDNSSRTVGTLHRKGSKAICYISAGSWENWRPDAGKFPKSVIGNKYEGWAGERWLDIRRINQLAPIMRARMNMCKSKGFDAIEPDNIDGYTNKTGFRITSGDQLRYNKWLAREAHARGLSIGLKNDEGQAKALVPYFDWAMTEDCFDEGWCSKMRPFAASNKAVFAAEYTDTGATPARFCSKARSLHFDAILKKRNLGAWRRGC